MLNRRKFFKYLGGVLIASGYNVPAFAIADTELFGGAGKAHKSPMWMDTIFCQFDNNTLKTAIEKCAAEIGCKIWNGEPFSSDIIAVPYFISVINRHLIGEDSWKIYLDYCNETGDDTPCIIIDHVVDLEVPEKNCISYFNMSDVHVQAAGIVGLIKRSKKYFDKRSI